MGKIAERGLSHVILGEESFKNFKCKNLCRIISARPWNLRDEILLDQPLPLLGHADPDVLLLMIFTQLHHGEDQQTHPNIK